MSKKTIMVVPLDNRPACLYNTVKIGEASGFNVITPPYEYIQTILDTTNYGTGYKYGNIPKLLEWIKANIHLADGFILSTDMIASGGLVGARSLAQDITPPTEIAHANISDIINRIKISKPEAPIYVFDIIIRPATTSNVEWLSNDHYNAFNSWGAKPRKKFVDFNDIVNNYDIDESGRVIPFVAPITPTLLDKYIKARTKKFAQNKFIAEEIQNKVDYTIFGIGDAKREGIQFNEVNYIEKRIISGKGHVFSEADSLGCTLMAKMSAHFYTNNLTPKIKILSSEYGMPLDTSYNDAPFEMYNKRVELLRQLEVHNVEFLSHEQVQAGNKPDIEIMTITRDMVDEKKQIPLWLQNALINKINSNNVNDIGTIVIYNGLEGVNGSALVKRIIAETNKERLLSFSSWNTFGNKVGIALGGGFARFLYMRYNNQTETERVKSTSSQATFIYKCFLKDYGYQMLVKNKMDVASEKFVGGAKNVANWNFIKYLTSDEIVRMNNYLQQEMGYVVRDIANENSFMYKTIPHNINKINGKFEYKQINASSVSRFNFDPFNRTFEINVFADLFV